jgi:hypothetical protein
MRITTRLPGTMNWTRNDDIDTGAGQLQDSALGQIVMDITRSHLRCSANFLSITLLLFAACAIILLSFEGDNHLWQSV